MAVKLDEKNLIPACNVGDFAVMASNMSADVQHTGKNSTIQARADK